jgi:hypothetical protein
MRRRRTVRAAPATGIVVAVTVRQAVVPVEAEVEAIVNFAPALLEEAAAAPRRATVISVAAVAARKAIDVVMAAATVIATMRRDRRLLRPSSRD